MFHEFKAKTVGVSQKVGVSGWIKVLKKKKKKKRKKKYILCTEKVKSTSSLEMKHLAVKAKLVLWKTLCDKRGW